mmetsp:Transcript_28509/g.42137  ORF Transcript_28509/g.42137 Transcript_28509/m.42137 type:complete len:152 (-) Transcript_28509:230-685(-)|eukprot:CAMPEP_0194226088 /NCGR_PEP_ID=MMETSP0156-20130528/41125_1 /TAXON_ID=33649 /ORGANISM="Thalassionema nitzschioides, Strain L26-B" /LENGTH=151 /DNA_ID=CAMNT_0038958313 /DNA_START=85 /DNA_END=543 /DNA_ORIENTATION=+
MPKKEETESAAIGSAVFELQENGKTISFAEEFKDKVRAIHEHFDKDGDGFLCFEELTSLQEMTSGADMDGTQFGMVCQALGCRPSQGLGLDALRLTYASEGSSVDDDYDKVFGKPSSKNNSKTKNESNKEVVEDDVIEVVGDGPIDISPDH